MSRQLRILASPGFSAGQLNPYTPLLYSHLDGQVDEYSVKKVMLRSYDILHIHWPEGALNYSDSVLMAALRLRRQLAAIDVQRMRRCKVFWTVHNLHAHDCSFPSLEEWMWKSFTERLDGYIALSESGKAAALKKFPALRTIPGFVIPHGNYRNSYIWTGSDPRRVLEVPSNARVILFLGRICPYKNVPKLIKEFKAMEEVDARLIIAGRPSSDKVAAEVTQGRAGDHRIRLDLGHISQEKVCQYFQAADLVALPYTDILNSGTALLSLSLDRPVLVPNLGALRELAEEVGTQWVRCYDGHLTAQELSAALRWAQSATRPAHAPVDHLAWPSIGNKTLEAYKTVLADKGA